MKKNLWLLALSLVPPVSLFAHNSSAESVSIRLVDAINSGKFYMKTGGIMPSCADKWVCQHK